GRCPTHRRITEEGLRANRTTPVWPGPGGKRGGRDPLHRLHANPFVLRRGNARAAGTRPARVPGAVARQPRGPVRDAETARPDRRRFPRLARQTRSRRQDRRSRRIITLRPAVSAGRLYRTADALP